MARNICFRMHSDIGRVTRDVHFLKNICGHSAVSRTGR